MLSILGGLASDLSDLSISIGCLQGFPIISFLTTLLAQSDSTNISIAHIPFSNNHTFVAGLEQIMI